MLLPGSFSSRYAEIWQQLEKVQQFLRSRLEADLLDLRPVTLQTRIKSADSVLAKLQRGEFKSLYDLDDLVAARGVFLHSSQVEEALAITRASFPEVLEEKNIGVGRPTDFRYQQPHLIVKLPREYVSRHPELAQIRTEIQFTTYVQHALQESTHDLIYKGGRFSWREHRLEGQLRGLLEIVDEVLEHISVVADAADDPPYEIFDKRNYLLEVLQKTFPAGVLPSDFRRLVITVEEILTASGLSVEDLPDLMARHSDLVAALSLTVVDKVLGAVIRENASQLLAKSRRKFVVTAEMTSLVPEADYIPPDRRVEL